MIELIDHVSSIAINSVDMLEDRRSMKFDVHASTSQISQQGPLQGRAQERTRCCEIASGDLRAQRQHVDKAPSPGGRD
jgi:hypothetical protein